MSKIGPVVNFDFWSKVNAKVKVNCPGSKSTVSANGSNSCSPGRKKMNAAKKNTEEDKDCS